MLDIFRRHHWLGLFELLKGYDDDIAYEFSMALNSQTEFSATTVVRGLVISLIPKLISRVETLPLGIKWGREYKTTNSNAKNNFFIANENTIEDKNGVRREILSYP